ncbi:MAG TPA: YIP1 family protein [Thermoanaerobaculia bacterium]|nr:YIP1 family protein [Thermoanaerobaculia bacterium]
MHESAFGRLVSVLIAPGKTFRSIAERPTWVVAFAVLLVLGLVAFLLFVQRADFLEIARQQMEAEGREMPPEMEQAGGMIRGCGMAVGLIGPMFIYFGVPLVLWGVFALLGGTINYRTSLAVSLHAMMPKAVEALLEIPVVLSRDSLGYEDLKTGMLMSSLGAFAPEDTGPVLLELLASMEFFTIWCVVLLMIGYRIAAKVSLGKAAAAVLGLWAVGIAIKVGLAALGAAQGGGA